jgi:hypothetical protein
MSLRQRIKKPQVLISAGLFVLAVASTLRFAIQPRGPLPDGWGDAVMGFGYGLAIGLMLVGVAWKAKQMAINRGSY